MGMYTELVMACELPNNTPENTINIIQYMLGNIEEKPEIEDNPLFDTSRWTYMLNSSSYYFIKSRSNSYLRYDEIAKQYILSIWCNLKNYDEEIDKFLNWIVNYTTSYGFVGYTRYEEFDNPTLIYFENNTVKYKGE